MADFKTIETQEQFDEAIKTRLERDRKTYRTQFEEELKTAGWKSPEEIETMTTDLNGTIKTLREAATETEKRLAEKDAKIAEGAKYRTDLEKTRIALAVGLDPKYADRLRGENEEEWKADAASLAKDFAAAHRTAPLGSSEGAPASSARAGKTSAKTERDAYRAMLNGLDASGSN